MKIGIRIIIIGAGITGLTVGAYIAKKGHKVVIYEQNPTLRGTPAEIQHNGKRWGQNLLEVEGLGPHETLGKILTELNISDQIKIQKMDRAFIFPDFTIQPPSHSSDPLWRMEYLKTLFPDDQKGLNQYWRYYRKYLKLITIGEKMEFSTRFKSKYYKIRLFIVMLFFLKIRKWSAARFMKNLFESTQLQAVFTAVLHRLCVPPSEFHGLEIFGLNYETFFDKRITKQLRNNIEQNHLYYIKGGLCKLMNALAEQIKLLDGEIKFNQHVSCIKIHGNYAKGVVLNEKTLISSDYVISTADAAQTFENLISPDHLPRSFLRLIQRLPLTESLFMLHMAVDLDLSSYLASKSTYVFGTYEIDQSIRSTNKSFYQNGKDVYVIDSLAYQSSNQNPDEPQLLTIYTYAPNNLVSGDWETDKEIFANQLINRAKKIIPNLDQHILDKIILTPLDFQSRSKAEFHAYKGMAPLQGFPGIPHKTPIKNFLFMGAQSESGGGIKNLMTSARRIAQIFRS